MIIENTYSEARMTAINLLSDYECQISNLTIFRYGSDKWAVEYEIFTDNTDLT